MSLKDNLEHKIGPLPAIAWAAIPAAGFIGWRYYKHSKQAAVVPVGNTGDATFSPNTGSASDLSSASDFTSGFTNSTPPSPGSINNAGTYTDPTVSDNTDWSKRAVNWLISQGVNPITATTALSSYVYSTGQALNDEQTAALNEALIHFGTPPEGVIAPPPTTTAPVVTNTAPATPAAAAAAPVDNSNNDRIQSIFHSIMGRDARPDELNAYANVPSSTISGVLSGFADSLQNQNSQIAGPAQIQAVFIARMGRPARQDEIDAYTKAHMTTAGIKAQVDNYPDSLKSRGLI